MPTRFVGKQLASLRHRDLVMLCYTNTLDVENRESVNRNEISRHFRGMVDLFNDVIITSSCIRVRRPPTFVLLGGFVAFLKESRLQESVGCEILDNTEIEFY